MVTPSPPKTFLTAWLPSFAATVSDSGFPMTSPAAQISELVVWKHSSTRIVPSASGSTPTASSPMFSPLGYPGRDEQSFSGELSTFAIDLSFDDGPLLNRFSATVCRRSSYLLGLVACHDVDPFLLERVSSSSLYWTTSNGLSRDAKALSPTARKCSLGHSRR